MPVIVFASLCCNYLKLELLLCLMYKRPFWTCPSLLKKYCIPYFLIVTTSSLFNYKAVSDIPSLGKQLKESEGETSGIVGLGCIYMHMSNELHLLLKRKEGNYSCCWTYQIKFSLYFPGQRCLQFFYVVRTSHTYIHIHLVAHWYTF